MKTAEKPTRPTGGNFGAPDFTLGSREFGGQLARRHYTDRAGYGGGNQSPQLYWEHAPAGTRSFAVTMYDMDASTGSGFWHWLVFDLPAGTHELAAGAGDAGGRLLPEGAVQSSTDAGVPGYYGAAPGPGPAHRYFITVYALGARLGLDAGTTPPLVGSKLLAGALARASLVAYGTYPAQ